MFEPSFGMKTQVVLLLYLAIFATALVAMSSTATAAGTAFTYQGRLQDAGAPASGRYDLRFELFSAETGAIGSAGPVTNSAVAVSNGLFAVSLDFGTSVFSGAPAWLEIGVRPAESLANFTILAPRQLLTPTPYAIYTLKAESLNGLLPDSQLSTNVARLNANQTFTGAITFSGDVAVGTSDSAANLDVQGSVRAVSVSGDGTGLSNVVASALSAKAIERLWRTPIRFVTVGDAGNDPDSNGKGAVAYNFRIGKYEINNSQYAALLNAVAADDPHSLYSSNMTLNMYGGITRSGSRGDFSYAVKSGMEHKPVVWVDFYDALRFCNWLHNGQPTGAEDASTTEDGAYTLVPETMSANIVARNPGARFWLPSDDEWYKAAYYQPMDADGPVGGYWLYPTRTEDAPFSEPPPGGVNSANACCETDRFPTDIGAYVHAASYYGTFDQAGNVQEWTEEILYLTNRRLRGGSWVYNEFYSKSTDLEFDTTDYDAAGIGFRVAGASEP